MNHRHLIAACVAVSVLAACQRGPEDKTAPASSVPPPTPAAAQGKAAPPVADGEARDEPDDKPDIPTLRTTTLDGKPYDLAAHRGRWVVVNFWATWCAPCRKEMPELSALDAMREHIEVLGLAYEDIEPAELRAFLDKHPVVYPVAIVDVYDPPADFATPRGLPMTYLIAPDGKVAKRFLGPVSAKDIEDVIGAVPTSG